jgi:hypothetical protein
MLIKIEHKSQVLENLQILTGILYKNSHIRFLCQKLILLKCMVWEMTLL